jgi:hypothetical protein
METQLPVRRRYASPEISPIRQYRFGPRSAKVALWH